jgi:platelet-activating factor acetylhydrolase
MSYIFPLVPLFGFPAVFRLLHGRVFVPVVAAAAPHVARTWPLVLFSHGLGCCRTTYSRVCYDMASHGFVVVAVEHRYYRLVK